ncbi:hypothetical protein CPB83DRAFT_379106 [Crepidotus variabilis]|uniref:Uncharacterized protein n=1 Tax=Crepidotus variabilis TaxID=179855 RepID=A0A9P6EF57_9AGAR|nr:hypothetical protein CPB83DRAFT_379106 [Crepidotus variabilis]
MASADNTQSASEMQQESRHRRNMSGHFTHSVSSVRNYTSQFEDQVVRPALGVASDLFGERPLLATFLATLLALSFFPVLAFLSYSRDSCLIGLDSITLCCFPDCPSFLRDPCFHRDWVRVYRSNYHDPCSLQLSVSSSTVSCSTRWSQRWYHSLGGGDLDVLHQCS